MTSQQTNPEFREDPAHAMQPVPSLVPPDETVPELPLEQLMAEAPDPHHGRFERPKPQKRKKAAPPVPEPVEDCEDEEEDDPPRRRHRVLRVLGAVGLCLALLLSLGVLGVDQWLQYHHARGKDQLKADLSDFRLELPSKTRTPENEEAPQKPVVTYDDGKTITYNGHRYQLNENLATILFLGIDKESNDYVDLVGTAGCSDVLFLLAIDLETGAFTIFNIPRDTYAEYLEYSTEGAQINYVWRQICLAYAYGDGRESSCENAVAAVRRLLYGLPISKYISLDIEGINVANDAIGGVTVTSLVETKMPSGRYVKVGDEITLLGRDCERYIRTRGDTIDANGPRMERQKQYVLAFMSKLTAEAKKDLGAVTRLYDQISPYLVSTLDLSDLIYLAQTYLDHGLSLRYVSYEGTYDLLENERGTYNAVFYADEDSLFEAVLSVYYTQLDDEPAEN